jgi:23S rRNA pseudouridine2605 synthase
MGGDNLVRLNKFIASSGFTARRKVDTLILEGRVTVIRNGHTRTIDKLGDKIDPEKDVVKVDGEIIREQNTGKSDYIYILLNKPAGYITSTSDEKNRPTVMDLVNIKKRIYPVGRLDYDTEGLLLLTNDGELANKLMHPKHEVNKTYIVKANKPIDEKQEKRLRSGIVIEGKKTSEAKLEIIPNSDRKQIKITIHEGRNRQVRKMLEAVGLFVRKLKRIEYGNLNLKGLSVGQWRYLSAEEVRKLKGNITETIY